MGAAMSQDREPEKIFREIEEEVQKLLKREKDRWREKTIIHYFGLKRGDSLLNDILDTAKEGDVILVSFEEGNLEDAKEKVSVLAKRIGEMGGKAYFIKWPTLLLMKKDVQLKIHR